MNNGPRNSQLNFSDVLDSESTLTFDLSKLKAKGL